MAAMDFVPSILRAIILAMVMSLVAVAEPIAVLQDSNVTYHGSVTDTTEHFMNIKFAHDTSGKRRFAPPEPYAPPKGSKIIATRPGPACPQSKAALPPFFDESQEISEDCLSLRISRPSGTTEDDRLPVVVWVHGGGVVKGSAYDLHFDPSKLLARSIELEKPVIYVALNYRITIFGFPQLPILRDQKSMNLGLRDQWAGLQWVSDHIAAFGGNSNRITVFGLSAGGSLPSLLLLAHGGEKGVPFSRLWAMSGPPGTVLNVTSDAIEVHTRAVADRLGCDMASDEEILECLRSIPMEALTEGAMEYSRNNHPPHGIHTFIPSVDGEFMPDRHSVLYKSGRFAKGIPIVYGWAHDDGSASATPASNYQTDEDMKDAFKPFAHALTDQDYRELFSLYPAAAFELEHKAYESHKTESDPVAPINFFRVSRMLRDILFSCSSIGFGYEMSRQSKELNEAFPGVRLYDLNQSVLSPMMASAGLPYLGVCHGSDTHYIFNGVFPEGNMSESDMRLSGLMTEYFINFAYTGNPAPAEDEHLADWPEAFPEPGHPDTPLPSSINLQLIGGTLGTGSSTLRTRDESAGIMQNVIGLGVEYAAMGSPVSQERQRAMEREKLLERCSYIDTLSEKLGI
ncbi:alpha/beta-hydrolase [Xylariaceae sp. FL0804]|nr:alpha/beta-hydrolase [Xylariaceae sp. FL0804]